MSAIGPTSSNRSTACCASDASTAQPDETPPAIACTLVAADFKERVAAIRDLAGRAYAAYGGIYIAASLTWLWIAEGQQPDSWDLIGGALAVVAAAVILFAPRTA